MTMASSFLGAICEVIPLSKDNSPLRSPDILRRETRIGVSKFGLEYVAGLVNGVLQEQIGKISEHRLQSDKFYNRLARKGTSHEYTDLNPKTLLRIVGSYVRKSQLKDKYDNILIEYYEDELSILTRSIVNLDMQIKLTDAHANYGRFFKLVERKKTFSKSIKDMTEKLATLNKERSIANPMRAQIVAQK